MITVIKKGSEENTRRNNNEERTNRSAAEAENFDLDLRKDYIDRLIKATENLGKERV